LGKPGTERFAWEHGRRNFVLRADGSLLIVYPISDGSDFKEVGIFNADASKTRRIMDEDPGVKGGYSSTRCMQAEASRETVSAEWLFVFT
jgi:hypothetical protein